MKELCYCVLKLNYFEKKIQIELDFITLKIVDEKFHTEKLLIGCCITE